MIHIRTILHCTDFSETAQQAWYVSQMLARDHCAKLVLVHAGESGASSFENEATAVDLVDSAYDRLRSMAEQAPELRVSFEVTTGKPGPAIVEAAQKWNADLIIMGTHGQTGLDRMIVGSVAEYVVRNAPCAVMTLKPGSGWALSQERSLEKPVRNVDVIS